MISYEITYGIKKRWLLLVLALIPVFFVLVSHMMYYLSSLRCNIMVPNTMNYHLGKILYGIQSSDGYAIQRNRQVPLQWFIFQFSYMVIISGYVFEERHFRVENIIRYGDYHKWWTGKILYFYLLSVCYYLVVGIGIYIEQRIEQCINVPDTVEIATSGYSEFNSKEYIYTCVYYILLSLILGLLQLCLELKIQSILALVINMGFLIVGVFSVKVITPCHFAMLIRNGYIVDNTKMAIGIIILGVICIIIETFIGEKICRNGI